MATRATTLFSTNVVKAYVPITGSGSDTIVEQIANGVSERIEAMTGRIFVTRSKTWVGDAKGRTSVQLPWFPISSVTSVKRRCNLEESLTALTSDDYVADTRLGVIHLKTLSFYDGPLTTEVVAEIGFGAQDAATLPADIYQAGLDYCKFVWTRQNGGMLVAGSMSQGGASVIVVPEPPKDIRDAIMAWRKVRL